jgi:Lrp/AsnC family transcriptional regulator, leucine-responsive regulatory protein
MLAADMTLSLAGPVGLSHGNMKAERPNDLHCDSESGEMPTSPAPDLLDDTNRRLLTELHADPRMTMSALGRAVGMSAPAVTERVQRLERAGIITGYLMSVDPACLGLPVAAFVRIRPTAGQLAKIAELAVALPQITECHRITGEDCFLIKVHAPTIAALETTLDQFLLYGQTVTSIVVSSPVPSRPLPIGPTPLRAGD